MIVPPGVQIQAGVAERRSGYAAVSNMSVPPPAPPMGKVPPMSQVIKNQISVLAIYSKGV